MSVRWYFLAFAALTIATSPSWADVLTFEGLPDGTVIDTQFAPAVTVSGMPVIVIAGWSLNEIDFPPHSPVNAIANLNGPITFNFGTPVASVEAYFTYAAPLTLTALGPMGTILATKRSALDSNLGTTELIPFSGLPEPISSLEITGETGSFILDDLTFAPVPEPGSWLLLLTAAATGWVALRRSKP